MALGERRERFESRVIRSEGCWEWAGYRNRFGYGVFTHGRRNQWMAHRFAYELFVGPIPDGLHIDHTCQNRGCVNPDHLEPVTPSENSLRVARRKTHCLRGHPYDSENTLIDSKGARVCRACRRENYARAKKRHEVKRPSYGIRDRQCRNGHPRTPENTRTTKAGGRSCLICEREQYTRTRLKPGGYFDPNRQRASACPHGHDYTPENTYEFQRNGRTYRRCRECNRLAARKTG